MPETPDTNLPPTIVAPMLVGRRLVDVKRAIYQVAGVGDLPELVALDTLAPELLDVIVQLEQLRIGEFTGGQLMHTAQLVEQVSN